MKIEREEFELPPNPSDEARRRWRKAVGYVVKNHRRRFRHCIDPDKKEEAEAKKISIQEKFRVLFFVQRAALTFIQAGSSDENGPSPPSEETRNAGFGIDADKLASIAGRHDWKKLCGHGELNGISRLVSVTPGEGVASSSLASRQNIYGCNRYVEKPPRSLFAFICDAFQDLTLIILMVCAAVSVAVGLGTEGWPKGSYDGIGIVLSILLVVTVTAISDYRQSLQFRDLDKEKKKIPVQVTRDGFRQKVLIFDLVVGDIVHLSIGDQVPADGLFIKGYSLLIDESSLSGESEPVNISEKWPFLLAGTKVQDGSAAMLVTSVGMRTEWGKLMETLSEGGVDETPLQVKLHGVATVIGKIGLVFAVSTFVVLLSRFLAAKAIDVGLQHWYPEDALQILDFFATAVTIIVVAVPEGLPLAVTLSLAFAMKKLMDHKALVRKLTACETMGSAGCICTDKTGTLTTNHMVVDKVWICENSMSFAGEDFDGLKSMISEEVRDDLLQCIFLNSGSEVVRDKDGSRTILGTPTESALLEFGLALGGDFNACRKDCPLLKVEPFNSNKKKMSVLASLPGGKIRSFCKGASENILEMCDKIVNSNGDSVAMSEKQRIDAFEIIKSFAKDALRTISVAFRDVDMSTSGNDIPCQGYTLLTIFGIKDPVRPGVKEAVEACKAAGITVRMVTGDNIYTAKAIAKECGILTDDGLAIEGSEFRNLSPKEMKELIPRIQVMARSLPLDKHTLVTNLRHMFEEVVAATGDGTNDAPALHEADIGFAMGIAGTEVAKESADVVVMDDNFTTITNVAKWGRAVYINIQKFVQFQLTVNVVALMLNFFSSCFIGRAPLTAVQLLWVNMIMDTFGALALATEPPGDRIMKRPPVSRHEDFITKIMWRNIIGQSIYQLAVLGILMFEGKNMLKISGPHEEAILNTFIFNTFVFCQIFNEVNSRDMEKINVFRGIFKSWIFLTILAVTVAFQVVIVQFLGTFSGTVPLQRHLWLISILLGSLSMIVAVLLKCIPVVANMAATIDPHDYKPLPTGPEDV